MSGVLNVDTIADNAGTGPVSLTKQSAAKAFSRFNPSTNTELSSLNQSSRSDDGTGLSTVNFTNSFNDANHSGVNNCAADNTPTTGDGANLGTVYGQTTALTKLAYGYAGSGSGTTWLLLDYPNQKLIIHGDLA